MTERGRRRGLDALVFGTVIGIAGTVAAYSFVAGPSVPRDEARAEVAPIVPEPVPPSVEPAPPPEATDLEAQLAAALRRIDDLYAERERDWRHTAAWVETLLDTKAPGAEVELAHLKRFREKLEIRKKAESGNWFADVDDTFMLLFATLLAGDEAIRELCDVAADGDPIQSFA